MRISCLQRDTHLKEALFDVVKTYGLELAAEGKSASLASIYKKLRKAKIEVDLETVGFIYNEVLPRDDANFDSQQDIEDYTGRTYSEAVSRLAELSTIEPGSEKQIGEQSAETRVANLIVNALYNNITGDEKIMSEQRVLQEALWKGVQRMLGPLDPKAKKDKKTMEEILDRVFGLEDITTQNIDGTVNTITDLFYSMKDQLKKASDEIRNGSENDVDQVDKWNAYVEGLETATYQLMFSKPEARQVLMDALKKAGFGKKTGSGTEIIDWNKLSRNANSVSDLRLNVDAALQGVFPQPAIERIKDSLQREFYELKQELVDRQLSNIKMFGAQGFKSIQEESGLKLILGDRTIGEWIKSEKVENVEALEARAKEILSKAKYEPAVINNIVERLNKFYDENYARVDTEEARRVIESMGITAPSGKKQDSKPRSDTSNKTVVDWIKENGIQNENELYEEMDKQLEGRDISDQNKQQIRSEFKRILDVKNKAENDLLKREKAAKREYAPKKTDLQRMIELYHLGVFNERHNDILYKLLGFDGAKAQDLADLEAIAKAASDLSLVIKDPKMPYRLMEDVFANREFQRMQRHVDSIIERNISNKTLLLRIFRDISRFIDIMLTSTLGMPSTMVQNILSGAKSILTGARVRPLDKEWRKRSSQSFDIWWSMLKDVTRTGQAYGEEIGSFSTRELYSNTLQWKLKWGEKNTGKEWFDSIMFAVTAPMRVGLLAFDSANKVALTNKVFYNMVYNSLLKHGAKNEQGVYVKMTKDEAMQFMNEMLYGQSFEQAKAMAQDLMVRVNENLPEKFRSKITKASITTLANDIVKANLNASQKIDNKMLEAAMKSSYHVAGIGLGHEPNNPFSRGIKLMRDYAKRNEIEFAKNKQWNSLLWTRVGSSLFNNFIVRFAAGGTNWLYLRAKEGLGFGLISGGYSMIIRNSNEVDFTNESTLRDEMRKRESARNDIGRAAVGAAYTTAAYMLGGMLLGSDDDDDKRLKELRSIPKNERTKEQSKEISFLSEKAGIYGNIKENITKDRWFRAMAPDAMLIQYYNETDEKNPALLKYAMRTYMGSESFSVSNKVNDAMRLYSEGDSDAGGALLLSIITDKFSVPVVRQYKEYYRMAVNIFRQEDLPAQKYTPPTDIRDAILGGGAIEALGLYGGGKKITAIKGIGYQSYKKFQDNGIETFDDMYDGFWNKKHNGSYILDATERKNVQEFYNKYKKEK